LPTRRNASIYWSGKRCHNQSEIRIIDARFNLRDANGQALAYVYFEDKPGRRSAAHLLTRDGARRIAAKSLSYRSCCAAAPDERA
jgi:hypothetical protein